MRQSFIASMLVVSSLLAGLVPGGRARAAEAPAGAPAKASAKAAFPQPAVLDNAVRFWRKIFAHYSRNDTLVHDSDDLARVYEVLHFPASESEGARRHAENAAADRVATRLRHIAAAVAAGKTPSSLPGKQRQLAAQFNDSRDAAVYRRAADDLRTQRGLRERTERAMRISGRYLPAMTRIFASYNLPVRLTRLPIVESSFNVDAYSKVGAAGIWQFIPSSARMYMTLDAVQDDRRDPWTSTDAAARHLRDDYAALGSWPLALTAYNYGRVGLMRALSAVNGHTLQDLLARYHNPRFGFASRNFYAEFLAAVQVMRDRNTEFPGVQPDAPLRFQMVKTRDYLSYSTLRQLAGCDEARFRQLNPSFDDAVLEGRLYVPPQTTIRVPDGHAQSFDKLYAALAPDERFSRQRVWYVAYRVQRGDVLGSIASHHHVSVHQIMRYNGLSSPRLIRVGQVLRIPTGGSSAPAPRTVEATYRRSSGAPATYRVRRGDVLGAIAHRYGVDRTRADAGKPPAQRASDSHRPEAAHSGRR
jgi:FOG: LysM repeat